MLRLTIPSHHVYCGTMEARLKYPLDRPPDVIKLDRNRWVLERTAKRKWDERYGMYVCPTCNGRDVSSFSYCPNCGVKFISNDGHPPWDTGE